MKESVYKKVEYYLYNYKDIDNIIEDIRENIIDSVDISGSAWLRGKNRNSNTVENQAIRLADNKKIYTLRKVKAVISHYMKVFRKRNPKRYNFIKMKYFDKANPLEIQRTLKYDEKQQKDITIYKKCKKMSKIIDKFIGKYWV